MAARLPFWKWRCWKSIGFCLWPPSTCIWNLKLKFQSKLDLCSGNHVIYRQTDGRTDGRTRWIQYTPPPTSLGGGITIAHSVYDVFSFVHHFNAIGNLKLKLQSGNAQFGSKSANSLSRVILKFEGWPWKIIGHLFYATSKFVHHFVAIGEFKLELQLGNAQFGSKSMFF